MKPKTPLPEADNKSTFNAPVKDEGKHKLSKADVMTALRGRKKKK